ncbi:MAG: hypothetical protein RLZZ217_2037, partial [Planctomycetota bacterium]
MAASGSQAGVWARSSSIPGEQVQITPGPNNQPPQLASSSAKSSPLTVPSPLMSAVAGQTGVATQSMTIVPALVTTLPGDVNAN